MRRKCDEKETSSLTKDYYYWRNSRVGMHIQLIAGFHVSAEEAFLPGICPKEESDNQN